MTMMNVHVETHRDRNGRWYGEVIFTEGGFKLFQTMPKASQADATAVAMAWLRERMEHGAPLVTETPETPEPSEKAEEDQGIQMNLDPILASYEAKALRTESKDWSAIMQRLHCIEPTVRLIHAAMGLASEVGELAGPLWDHALGGEELDKANILEELGDVCWYAAIAANALEIDLSAILTIPRDFAPGTMNSVLCALGLITEAAGKINDAAKRHVFYGNPIPKDDMFVLIKHLVYGVEWMACLFDSSLSDVCAVNIAKLAMRYPEQFTQDKADRRDVKAERAVMLGELGLVSGHEIAARLATSTPVAPALAPLIPGPEAAR